MKEALEKIMEELRSTSDDAFPSKQKPISEPEEDYPGKWDYYVETD